MQILAPILLVVALSDSLPPAPSAPSLLSPGTLYETSINPLVPLVPYDPRQWKRDTLPPTSRPSPLRRGGRG